MNGKRSHNLRVFTNFLAYGILIVIAILLVVSRVFLKTGNVAFVVSEIAKYLAIFLVAIASLWYAVSKRNLILKLIWFVSVGAIVVLFFV